MPALHDALLDQIAQGTLEVPLLPQSAHRIMALAGAPDADARKLGDLIQRDATVSGHTLRLANSPLYRGAVPIVSVQQAVVRLGSQRIRQIALAVGCKTALFEVRGFESELGLAFRHALLTALVSQRLARELREPTEEAFLSGLFHDIGQPVLVHAALRIARRSGMKADRNEILHIADELHVEAGVSLLRQWSQPGRVVATVTEHHKKEPPREVARSVRLLQLADCMADPSSSDDIIRQHPAIEVLELYPDAVEALLAFARDVPESLEAAA